MDGNLELMLLLRQRQKQKKRENKRRYWIHPILKERLFKGDFFHLIPELKKDEERFCKYFRMEIHSYENIIEIVSNGIENRNCNFRKDVLSVEHKVALTLRYLASGDSIQSIALAYRVGVSTARKTVYQICTIIWQEMHSVYLKFPETEERWLQIAKEFEELWQFPNCIGALDGKHFRVQCPKKSGSQYYNYKNYFSMVLLALVDAKYRFVWVDFGTNGRNCDAGIFNESSLNQGLVDKSLNVPNGSHLPYVVIADAGLPIKEYLMTPYSGKGLSEEKKIFNYRLSRARRVSENAFGILSQRWRIFNGCMQMSPDNVDTIVKATLVLHNYLQSIPIMQDTEHISMRFNESQLSGSNENTGLSAIAIRDNFKDYFNNNGSVEWQRDFAMKGLE